LVCGPSKKSFDCVQDLHTRSGIGPSLSIVILGRVITGIGGAGANALVSLIILGRDSLSRSKCFAELETDLVPLREVASLRSYVNVAATTGRSLGGPIGGALADTIGWRW
jgi:MFS family permease